MRKQIVHISVHQTSKVIAAMHAAMVTVLFVLPTVLGHLFHGKLISGLLIFVFAPFFLWLIMYIGYIIACWFYNLVIPLTGGIEIEMKDVDIQMNSNILKPHSIEVPSEKADTSETTTGPIDKL